MCLWIYQGGRFPLELPRFSLIFHTTMIFGEILEPYYLETLKMTSVKIICYQKQYRHSLRAIEQHHFTYLLALFFSIS